MKWHVNLLRESFGVFLVSEFHQLKEFWRTSFLFFLFGMTRMVVLPEAIEVVIIPIADASGLRATTSTRYSSAIHGSACHGSATYGVAIYYTTRYLSAGYGIAIYGSAGYRKAIYGSALA